jgi:hypothetical protein
MTEIDTPAIPAIIRSVIKSFGTPANDENIFSSIDHRFDRFEIRDSREIRATRGGLFNQTFVFLFFFYLPLPFSLVTNGITRRF